MIIYANFNVNIDEKSKAVYDELFSDCSLETGKHLSKAERDRMNLANEKVCSILNFNYNEDDFSH